jgi:hypothetical protein
MKNARNAIRQHSEPPNHIEAVNDSEDELLLSPNKLTKPSGSKRSVSPPVSDEYSIGTGDVGHGRELKRMKWDLEEERGRKDPVKARLTKPGHARTNSEPSAGPSRKAPRKRADIALASNKPNSTSDIKPPPTNGTPTELSEKERARSVPLFSSSSLPSLPSLDLRNPPASPIRARSPSRSVDKSHGLKVHPSPLKASLSEQPPTEDAPLGESKVSTMDVDQEPSVPPVLDSDAVMDHAHELANPLPELSIQPPKSPAPVSPQNAPSSKPPATPIPSGLSLSASMSPLTPLPETPLPPGADVDEDRYTTKEGWDLEPGQVSIVSKNRIHLFISF